MPSTYIQGGERSYSTNRMSLLGYFDVKQLTQPVLELLIVHDGQDPTEGKASMVLLLGKFMHPELPMKYYAGADRLVPQAEHVYATA